ncbi:MAG: DVUA0089 family protein [Kofleriaceae bacterium]
MRLTTLLLIVSACATEADPYADPDLDGGGGKADGTAPVLAGALAWSAQDVALDSSLTYLTFELSGAADVALETTNADLDTILYVYRPDGERWGRYLAKNDDGGAGKLSKLTIALDAGAYRVLVIRKGSVAATVTLDAACTGAGCTPPLRGCEPLAPRTAAPEVFIGPDQWQSSIDAAIESATTSLDVQIYLFTVTEIADRIIAAHERGVAVRVLMDPDEPNGTVHARLDAANVPVRFDPPAFSFAHAKYLIIDGDRVVILSGNFNAAAMSNERNFAIVDRDGDDVADVQAIFEADWAVGPAPDLACTRLVVSPVNAQPRILDLVNSATATLDVAVLYVTEPGVRAAIMAAAARGVTVRVLLSDPARNPQNVATRTLFEASGIAVRYLLTNYLHAKMIQADGVALVGSENMSLTSFTKNREVGALVFEPVPAGVIHDRFDADWAASAAN